MIAKDRFTLFFGIVVALAACGPEGGRDPSSEARRYADAVCDAAVSCGCSLLWANDETCRDELVRRFDDARDRGNELDETCLDMVETSLAQDPCANALVADQANAMCMTLQGDRAQGETCSGFANLPLIQGNECAGDGACWLGVCLPPEARENPSPAEGAACWSEQTFSCGFDDLFCDADGRCRSAAAIGEPCGNLWGCETCADETCTATSYCAGARPNAEALGTCAVRPRLGEPCDARDWLPCAPTQDDGRFTWCDPAQSVCVEGPDPPVVCNLLLSPDSWRGD